MIIKKKRLGLAHFKQVVLAGALSNHFWHPLRISDGPSSSLIPISKPKPKLKVIATIEPKALGHLALDNATARSKFCKDYLKLTPCFGLKILGLIVS